MQNFRDGAELRKVRKLRGLSQAKLAQVTNIVQARISAYELGKNGLKPAELAALRETLRDLGEAAVQRLKVKRYRNRERSGSAIGSHPRRGYKRTSGNLDYLRDLDHLASLAARAKSESGGAPKALSIFAGCGGLSYGLKAAGFRIIGFSEIHKGFRAIYRLNFPEAAELPHDVRDLDEGTCKRITEKGGSVDVLAGGPPCQGFSLAGKRDPWDARNMLFYDYLRIAENIRPKVIFMENVRLLTSMKAPDCRFVTECIMDEFGKLGYAADFFCLNAKDYGVPQHRERVVFVAVRDDVGKAPTIPPATFGETNDLFNKSKPIRTFGDAVSDLEFLESGEESQKDPWHFAVAHPGHVIEWLINVPQGRSAHDNEDPRMRPPSGYNTTYKRQVWEEPGSTVGTTFAMISGCRNVHPIATRSLTIREAMRLQTFPDSFKLCGRIGDIRASIGNAVPPLLAFALASHIRDTYIL